MTLETLTDFINRAPIEVSDITFVLDADEFEELRFSAMQFMFDDTVILNINNEKITVFKKRK